MSKLRLRAFADWNLDRKLIFVYAVMIVIPVLIVTMLGFQRYQDNLTKRVGEFGLNLADQINQNLDNYVKQIDRISMTFYLNGVDGLTDKQDPLNAYSEKIAVDKALSSMMFIIPFQDIQGIYWVRRGEVLYSQFGSGQWIDHSGFAAAGWYDKVIEADGRGVIIPPYLTPVGNGAQQDIVFSYARSIVNVSNREPYGVLLIDLSTDTLRRLLTDAKIKTSSTLFLVDGEGRIVFHPDTERIGDMLPVQLPSAFGQLTETIDGRETMVQYVRSTVSGWTVVNTVPVKQLSDELRLLRNLLWTFAGAALLLSIVLSSALTMSIVRPLKRMKRLMRRVELGDYSVRYEAVSADEVGQLGRSFNLMVGKINELVNRVLHMRIFQQQAEFRVLRSQINPHFLFNTLESINMKAELNEDYEVADMVSLLGKLFRLSLQQNGEQIAMSRELQYVEVYMKLQRIRFPHMRYDIRFDEDLPEAATLPWIIQPLVENAIVHGIAPAGGAGAIVVRGRRDGGDMVLDIADDGAGMTAERLDEVAASLDRDDGRDDGAHIGLYNVHRRIAGYYGEGYGLTIRSRPGGGTDVRIRMPYRKEGLSDETAADDDRR